MSEARRYPLSEWGEQRLRRAGIRPSTAAWYTAAWSTALLLCVYSAGSTVAAFAGEFVDLAAGFGLPSACADRTEGHCPGDGDIGSLLVALGRHAFVSIAGLTAGIVALASALRVVGARPDAMSPRGWRTTVVTALATAFAGAALLAVGVWLACEAVSGAAFGTANPGPSLVDTASDWWMTALVTTAGAGCAVAAIHQWAARLDFQARWRMTERERRDELRDTQMSPDVRRALTRRRDQR